MSKLSIAIDMGAKNNGVFIVKSDRDKILDKKATCISIEKNSINFSKKSRRENRHKDRNYKRRKLAKRFIKELIPFTKYDEKQQENILGLLNNRGYTFLSTESEFEQLEEKSFEYFKRFEDIVNLKRKEDFEEFLSDDKFSDEKVLLEFLDKQISILTQNQKLKKAEVDKNFQGDFSKVIKSDLKLVKEFLQNIQKEIQTGSKPRKKYLSEIKEEIENLDFIEKKEEFYNFIGNISNLQLRVLRKFFNFNSSHKDRYEILKRYFKSHHYKKDTEKQTKEKFFKELEKYTSLEEFLKSCNPLYTIPPYEDMNNRDTYKCNSMLIKPSLITDELKYAVDKILENKYFSKLLISENTELEKKSEFRVRPKSGNVYDKVEFTYSKYLQRILDSTPDITTKYLNPRNVFKHMSIFDKGKTSSVKEFKKVFTDEIYFVLEKFASKYYEEERLITNGIYAEQNSIFEKCNTNTPYKNNAKHIMLKPLYSYNFTKEESDEFIKKIENKKIDNRSGLKGILELISNEAKKYQNGFYNIVQSCFENQKCVDDKEINKIINLLPNSLKAMQEILTEQNIKNSYFDKLEKIDSQNISRVLNIFKQTYEILFKDLNGFAKTCKCCTQENALRSDENLVIGKRLLSDVAKPIDGMLDMMLDRLAFEISENIEKDDLKDTDSLEILLEQNRFEFEENLNEIKRASNSQIKKYKREDKDKLNSQFCPYTGEKFDKGDYDHILPQSKGVYNSKANMIHASTKGNASKGNKDFTLEMLSDEHLKDIFKTTDKKEIVQKIQKGLSTIQKEQFKNFDALKLHEQIALRYALFMRETDEFNKAFELVKMDKLKTITNGTQKRLARIIYEKLTMLYPNEMKKISVNSKTVDNKLVSSTRKYLAVDENTGETNHLFKEDIQNSHSHCIDAMVVFYLANAKLKGAKHRQSEYISELVPEFTFDDIYLNESKIKNISKNKTFINTTFKESSSIPLFQGTIYAENYYIIEKKDDKFYANAKEVKRENIELLIKEKLLYKNKQNKKYYFINIDDVNHNDKCKIDIHKLSNLLYNYFIQKDKKAIDSFKFLDNLRYNTTRKEVVSIFFDDKQTKLLEFDKIKAIPKGSEKLFKAVYKKLSTTENIFKVSEDGKQSLNQKVLDETLQHMFLSKQKEQNRQKRKRGKKRHKFTLPILGQNAKYRIKRGNTWQVLGGENIATKNYLIDENIKSIPYFTKNTVPLKVSDLSDCLLLDKNSQTIYEVPVDVSHIDKINNLVYFISEASRHTVLVEFVKEKFSDINFDAIKTFDCAKDSEFQKFVDTYIETENEFSSYVNSMRNNKLDKKNGGKDKELKAVAVLVDNNTSTITLQYKAETNSGRKKIILDNLKTQK